MYTTMLHTGHLADPKEKIIFEQTNYKRFTNVWPGILHETL